jgi:hypothetical protein
LLDFEVLTAGLQRDIILLKAMRVAWQNFYVTTPRYVPEISKVELSL